MYKPILNITLFLFIAFTCFGQSSLNSRAILAKMYNRYHDKWPVTLQFNQTTQRYRNDSLLFTQEWEEYIQYPHLFRITFGEAADQNFVVYKNDSSYLFRKGKMVRNEKDENHLIFFLGGMYFEPFDTVLKKFSSLHYDLNKFHTSIWHGKQIYVLGANTNDEAVNQLWIDAGKLVAVRFIEYTDHRKEEGIFEKHISTKGGWTETKATFYFDNKKIQVEKYHEIKAGEKLPDGIFDIPQN